MFYKRRPNCASISRYLFTSCDWFAVAFTMSLLSFQERKDIIDSIAKSNGFDKYELEQSLSEKSELGEEVKVSIKDENREFHLLFKMVPIDGTLRNLAAFATERWIYEKVFPEFEKFQQDNGESQHFHSYPKCYTICNKKDRETVVLEDFKQTGYKYWNRRLPMDHNHLALVMKEYAKLHAMFLAMNRKNPERCKELKNLMIKEEAKETKKSKFHAFIAGAEIEIYGAIAEDNRLLDGLCDLHVKFTKLVDEIGSFYPDELFEQSKLVVNHGSFWVDNLVFKYEEPENVNPSKVLLSEWHSGCIQLPAYDVTNFLCVNSPKALLYDYKTYLKIYHDQLGETLKNMSYDAEEIYPLRLLEEHFKLFAQTSLLCSPVAFSTQQFKEEHSDVSGEGSTADEVGFEEKISAVNQRIRDLMTFIMDSGFI